MQINDTDCYTYETLPRTTERVIMTDGQYYHSCSCMLDGDVLYFVLDPIEFQASTFYFIPIDKNTFPQKP